MRRRETRLEIFEKTCEAAKGDRQGAAVWDLDGSLPGALQCGRLAWPGETALGIERDVNDTSELLEQRAQQQRGNDELHAAHEHQEERRGWGGVRREL